MPLVTAAVDGWAALRWAVFKRDGGCVAQLSFWFGDDTAKDQCRNTNGWLLRWNDLFHMEADHVRDRRGRRLDDEAHLVTVCPWHHRGSGWRIDTKDHRERARQVLAGLYPEAWAQ